MNEIFEYKIDIIDNDKLLPKIGTYWTIIEEFMIPESFISNNGEFMFKIEEDNLNNTDTWLLVIPKNIEKLIDFLNKKINYGEFLNKHCDKFYIVKWDLQTFEFYLDKKIEIKELENKIKYIANNNISYIDDKIINKIINFFINKIIDFLSNNTEIINN